MQGCGLVSMATHEEAQAVIDAMDNRCKNSQRNAVELLSEEH